MLDALLEREHLTDSLQRYPLEMAIDGGGQKKTATKKAGANF